MEATRVILCRTWKTEVKQWPSFYTRRSAPNTRCCGHPGPWARMCWLWALAWGSLRPAPLNLLPQCLGLQPRCLFHSMTKATRFYCRSWPSPMWEVGRDKRLTWVLVLPLTSSPSLEVLICTCYLPSHPPVPPNCLPYWPQALETKATATYRRHNQLPQLHKSNSYKNPLKCLCAANDWMFVSHPAPQFMSWDPKPQWWY